MNDFPIREDITMLPADDPERLKLNFVIKEMSGMPVSSTPPGIDGSVQAILDRGAWPIENNGDLQFFPIKAPDLKIGQELVFNGLMGGYVLGTVTEVDGDKATAESDNLYYWLHFGKDEDQCWTCWGQATKDALVTMKV